MSQENDGFSVRLQRNLLLICCLCVSEVLADDVGIRGKYWTVQSGDAHWQLVREVSGNRIYHREVEDSPIPAAMIQTSFDAPPDRLHAMVTDYERFAEFIPHVAESRILQTQGASQWVYHRLHFRAPVADRYYVIQSADRNSRVEENYYRVEWILSDRDFAGINPARAVRPKAFSGFWELQPLRDGSVTGARYAVHSDPGGLLPVWLVVRMTDRYLQQVVVAIRKRLEETG